MRNPIFYSKLDFDSQYILEENFVFYQKLTDKQRKLFHHRVVNFIEAHQFISREGILINQKIKLLIAGTAVMLSFGFDHYLYDLFDKILVYPYDYFSHISHRQHKGETNPRYGIIAFSWEDFEQGIIIKDDNLHLGLHEFAHALHFSFLMEKSQEAIDFVDNLNALLDYAAQDEVRKKLIENDYLREYAFENEYEFFAVMVEHFYESPYRFQENHPILFKMMGDLLQLKNIMD